MGAVVDLIRDIEGRQGKAPQADLTAARGHQRQAQFHLHNVEAGNSTGFHAPGEALRILNESTNAAARAA